MKVDLNKKQLYNNNGCLFIVNTLDIFPNSSGVSLEVSHLRLFKNLCPSTSGTKSLVNSAFIRKSPTILHAVQPLLSTLHNQQTFQNSFKNFSSLDFSAGKRKLFKRSQFRLTYSFRSQRSRIYYHF